MAKLMGKKKRKRNWTWLRYRKNDPAHNLCVAVQRYVHSNRGTAAVISGIQVQQFPEDGIYSYRVAVKVCGVKPEFTEENGGIDEGSGVY